MIEVTLTRVGACRVVHSASGATILTDGPPAYGGGGTSFSATDLLAAALGVCVATSIDRVVERHGIPVSALRLTVRKQLAMRPKRVAELAVTIRIAHRVPAGVRVRIERAAATCAVKRSLHTDIPVRIALELT